MTKTSRTLALAAAVALTGFWMQVADAGAKPSVFTDLQSVAPHSGSVFADIQSTTPRGSVFSDIQSTAPRSDVFSDLQKTAPYADNNSINGGP